MSTKARIEHVMNCSVDTFWSKLFFDEEFNRRLFLEGLGFESWKQVSLDETESQIVRVVDAVPKMADLPAPLKKLAEGGLGYRERGVFDKAARRVRLDVEPASLKGKLFIGGEVRCEPEGDAKCRRIYDASLEAKVFGVGSMIEKRLLSDIQKSYSQAAEFTNRYIAEKGM